MEGHHGVDISWLHHSHHKDHARSDTAKSLEHPVTTKAQTGSEGAQLLAKEMPVGVPVVKEDGQSTTLSQNLNSRPLLSHKRSGDLSASAKSSKDGKQSPGPGMARRGSWISNISSKFTSSAPTGSPSASPLSTPRTTTHDLKDQISQPVVASSPAAKDSNKTDATLATPPSPRGGSGFLQSALRRLSSSTGVSGIKSPTSGAICPRKIMNVDPFRERCQIDDLHPAKLRRVSFCVDVEIAAPPPPRTSADEDTLQIPARQRPSLTQLEKSADAKKAREDSVKSKEQAEAEALKEPEALATQKEVEVNDVESIEENLDSTPSPVVGPQNDGEGNNTRKKEKKKRSEEERKERKERKRVAAIANGTVPIEITRDESSSDGSKLSIATATKPQCQPTVDPLRIYRRCCQLRETNVLKRITDQLSAPSVCDPLTSGVVNCLDLTKFRMSLPDLVTLGDYLAVVPVKRLILEDCGLTDESLRVILAGLLAVKTPDQARFNKQLPKNTDGTSNAKTERLGVIEKVVLKNNPKIGRDGWQHVSLFLHMSRSLKAIDVSMIPFPVTRSETIQTTVDHQHHPHHQRSKSGNPNRPPSADICKIFTKCLVSRLSGSRLEEVVMAECGLKTNQVENIVRAITACGVSRLGLAKNNLSTASLQAIANWIATGQCEGLDLGGNDLSKDLEILTGAMKDENNPIYALSLAECQLTPVSLKILLPTLIGLNKFKFIDLSHNRALFSTQPNAIYLLRKYLPQMRCLKRVHLNDVGMDSEHCIALAEVLPEIPHLAHLGISENPKLTTLASAQDEASQEEACAYYASLMAAVRVSKSIVSLDIDMPTQVSSDLVKALGKQILAYALRNMERGPYSEITGVLNDNSLVEVPEILLHLVGHVEGFPENHDADEPAPNEDYIVSGTGVAKALGICLGNTSADRRRPSRDQTPVGRRSGAATPRHAPGENVQLKAKDMSKNLLDSARKIRARLQPALAREAKSGDEASYNKLRFLDSTLARMVERFEDEYPECRPKQPDVSSDHAASSEASSPSAQPIADPFTEKKFTLNETAIEDDPAEGQDEEDDLALKTHLSRHGSDVSLASRHLANEEGRMHRFGQQIRRSLLPPPTFDYVHQSTGEEANHLMALRSRLETFSGEEIKEKVKSEGIDGVLAELGSNAQELLLLEREDPEGFEKFKEAQLHAKDSQQAPSVEAHRSSIAQDAESRPDVDILSSGETPRGAVDAEQTSTVVPPAGQGLAFRAV